MKTETITVTVIREHDKLCILEKWLNNDTELENIVSKYIDYSIQDDHPNKMKCFHQIKNKITDLTLLAKIIKLSSSIAFQTPYQLTIETSNNVDEIVQYFNQPFISLWPTFSFLSSF